MKRKIFVFVLLLCISPMQAFAFDYKKTPWGSTEKEVLDIQNTMKFVGMHVNDTDMLITNITYCDLPTELIYYFQNDFNLFEANLAIKFDNHAEHQDFVDYIKQRYEKEYERRAENSYAIRENNEIKTRVFVDSGYPFVRLTFQDAMYFQYLVDNM